MKKNISLQLFSFIAFFKYYLLLLTLNTTFFLMYSNTKKPSRPSNLKQNWLQGPISDKTLEPGHGRPIYCMSIQGETLVTGSGDHGLRVYNLSSGQHMRELFAKKYGHKEWVTTCAHLPDGRLLSGAMDSQLCLWEARSVKCDHILSHGGSISKVMCDDQGVGVSASYDCTMLIWDLNSKNEAMRLAGPHKAAVLDFAWHNSLLVSGDKNGVVAFWDINEGQPFKIFKEHGGAISQVVLSSDGSNNMIITAGITDGLMCIHDMRSNKLIFKQQIHSGAINAIKVNDHGQIITGSADKSLKIFDIASGFKHAGTMKCTDAVFCMETFDDITIAGSGDGSILAYDNNTQECLYGYGVMQQGCIRLMQKTDDLTRLVVAGDDPCPVLLYYV